MAGTDARDGEMATRAFGTPLKVVTIASGSASCSMVGEGGASPRIFDGDFADPKKRASKPPKISPEEYLKLYTDNDATYAKLLDVLLAELKKIQ